jgi:hypothetical protein
MGRSLGQELRRPCRLFVGCKMCIPPTSPQSARCRCACHHTLSAGFDATRLLMSSPPAGLEAPSSRRMGETGAGPGIPGSWLNESGSGHAHRVNRVRKSSATKSKRKSSFGSIRDSPTQIWCARKQNRYRRDRQIDPLSLPRPSIRSLQRHKPEPGSACQRMLINTL